MPPLYQSPLSHARHRTPTRVGSTRRTGNKGSLTNSPLVQSDSPVHLLALRMQEYLHMPDPSALYAVLGTVAANMLPGPSVWLMLVGPPSCGKTELLNSLMNLPQVVETGHITGAAALLSATPKKDIAKGATGGLLRQIGTDGGALVSKDFTSVLSLYPDSLKDLLSALREIYDGRWTRNTGTDGGRQINWVGKVAFIAACTPAIDNHHAINAELGERWIYYRYPETTGWAEATKALGTRDMDGVREEIRALVEGFFASLNLDWSCQTPKRDLTFSETSRIVSIATISSKLRSAVVRDNYNREVVDVASAELPPRLAMSLGQLYLGMEVIGADEGERWSMLWRLGLGCTPRIRRLAFDYIRGIPVDSTTVSSASGVAYGIGGNPVQGGLAGISGKRSTDLIQAYLRVSDNTARRVLEDLSLHGLIRKTGGKGGEWVLTDWSVQMLTECGQAPL